MNFKTARVTIALGVVATVALLVATWFLAISPTTDKLAETSEELTNLAEFNESNQVKLRQLQAAEEGLDQTRSAEAQLNAVFPDTAEQLSFFEDVNEAASAAGIDPKDITSLTPTAPVLSGDATSDPAELAELAATSEIAPQVVTLTVTASPNQAEGFLRNLEAMDRAFFLTSVSLAGEDGDFVLSVTGATFVAPALIDPAESAPANGAATEQ